MALENGSGALEQTVTAGEAISEVVINAASGYLFPEGCISISVFFSSVKDPRSDRGCLRISGAIIRRDFFCAAFGGEDDRNTDRRCGMHHRRRDAGRTLPMTGLQSPALRLCPEIIVHTTQKEICIA